MIIEITPEEITVLSSFLSKINRDNYTPIIPKEKKKTKEDIKAEKFKSFRDKIMKVQQRKLKK